MESEDHYRHAGSRPVEDKPDFTAGLLDLCRGLELLLNERLGAMCAAIARRILDDTKAMIDVGRNLPDNMRQSLRESLEKILKKYEKRKTLSISEIAMQLHIGKSAKGLLDDRAKAILDRTPGPADVQLLAILNLINSDYRNGKMHPTPESTHKFTEREEMQALRKLVFGIDEEKSVQKEEILDRISKTSWLPRHETQQAIDRVSQKWGKFPGVLSVLWTALGPTTITSTAA